MAQRNLLDKLKTLLMVSVISVLVWLYAEATLLQQETGRTVQLLIDEPTNTYAITPKTANVVVNYRASSGQIQRFNTITGVPLIHEIDPTGITEPTDLTVILDEALVRAGLGDIGITEPDVEPATLTVTLEPLVKVELPIVVSADFPTSGELVPEPDSITVTAPYNMAQRLEGRSITARLRQPESDEGTGRERVATDVPLIYPAALDPNGQGVTIDEPAAGVRVNYTLENTTETVVVNRVPLYINLPVDVQLRYTVRPQDQSNFLRDVELQGPADVINRIRVGDLPVRAELTITDLTKIEETNLERPKIIAPAGVTPVQVPEVMEIKVTRREPTPGG